jgi:NADH:ubiquinone oxidoreductase subunit 3 (subunit A)
MAKKMNEMLTIQNSNSMLFEIYYALGDYEKALDFHIRYKNANDSLTSNSNIEKMTRLQMQFEYEKAEKEKEEQRLTLRNTYIITVFGLVVIVLILILLFFLARSRNTRIQLEKSKLEEDMIMKNKELTTNVMYLLQKNELINNISVRLLKLKDSMKEENKKAVQGIIHDLQSIADKDIWEEFELRFQNVHQGFYDNLKKRFPDLTPSEIKLAAFLKLNMTTKEISSITGQAANSIETARYRLRKKLGITNQEVNLVNFLLQF